MNNIAKDKMNKLLFFFLFLLGIIPAIIYACVVKSKKKKHIDNSKRMNEILEEAEKLSSEE